MILILLILVEIWLSELDLKFLNMAKLDIYIWDILLEIFDDIFCYIERAINGNIQNFTFFKYIRILLLGIIEQTKGFKMI
jgi:hypothetical protein